jgi:hypothetical protein
MGYLSHPWKGILHLRVGEIATKHMFNFCPLSKKQLTVQCVRIFYVILHTFLHVSYFLFVSICFLMIVIIYFEKVGHLFRVYLMDFAFFINFRAISPVSFCGEIYQVEAAILLPGAFYLIFTCVTVFIT